MTGKAYYLTTLSDWQRHAARFANSHFIVLDPDGASQGGRDVTIAHENGQTMASTNPKILVLIEADEGVHLSLEDDAAFQALPHPLAQKSISSSVETALAPHGVPPGATTFVVAEVVGRVHPILRHRVF